MPPVADYTPRPRMAECIGCGVYAVYPVATGTGWAVIHCPICGPVLLAGVPCGPLPACYAHLWRSRGRSAWHLEQFG